MITFVASRLMGAIAIALGITACAHEINVTLPVANAAPAVANVGSHRVVTILRPVDARANPVAVGIAPGVPACWNANPCTSPIARTNGDVAVWIGNAFVNGLEQAGFKIERAEKAADAPSRLSLEITVNAAHVWPDETRVAVLVEGFRDGQADFRRNYSGVTTGPAKTSQDYENLLQTALQNMINQAIPNLAAALANEPA